MGFGVIADGVAARRDFLGERGKRAHVATDQEERGFGVVAIHKIEDFRRDSGVGAVVEGDRDRGLIVEAAKGGAEEL